MPKTENGQSASTWRKRDKKYREQEKMRRKKNAVAKADRLEASARGITIEQLRSEREN